MLHGNQFAYEGCKYFGSVEGTDVWLSSDNTLLIRHGARGHEFRAMPLDIARSIDHPLYIAAVAQVDAVQGNRTVCN